MLDNIDVAIMTKINELADCYGLKPYDFVASVQDDRAGQGTILAFEVPASGDALREEQFDKMLGALGVREDGRMKGPARQIIDALDTALHRAPKPRPRY